MNNLIARRRGQRERGVGAFEIALVIVLIAIVAAGTLWVVRGTDGKIEAQSLRGHLDVIIETVVRLSIADPTYENISTSALVNSGLLPEKTVVGGAIRNPAGGYTYVSHQNVGPQCGVNSCANVFNITITGVLNPETCTTLMSFENASRVQRRYALHVPSGTQVREDQDYLSVCVMDGEKHIKYSVK